MRTILILLLATTAALAQAPPQQVTDPEVLNAVISALQAQRDRQANADVAAETQLRQQIVALQRQIEDLRSAETQFHQQIVGLQRQIEDLTAKPVEPKKSEELKKE